MAARRRDRRTPRASSPTPAPRTCSRCRSWRSRRRARCRSPARGSPRPGCRCRDVLVTVRPGRARQARARPLPAGGRAARRRSRRVPGDRGRAGGDRRRPRRGHDGVGGRDDARAGRADRRPPDRRRAARAARRASRRGAPPEQRGDLRPALDRRRRDRSAPRDSSAAARDAGDRQRPRRLRSSGTSFVPSPTASTVRRAPGRARRRRRTPAHFDTPGAITVSPQSGQTGSGAISWPKPAASERGRDRRQERLRAAEHAERVDRLGGDRRGGLRGARHAGERGLVTGVRRRSRREHDVDVALEHVHARREPVGRERGERPPAASAANSTAWKRVRSGCTPIAPLSPTTGSGRSFASSSARAPRGRRAVAASTGCPAAPARRRRRGSRGRRRSRGPRASRRDR